MKQPLCFSQSFLVVIVSVLSWNILCCKAEEVPMRKAERPKMDPKPTMPEITHKVFLDVDVQGETSTIVLGLFGQVAPKAVENFRALCACDKGNGAITGKPLCYKGSTFHRIIPNFMIQGGDFTHGDGTGGESIYGGRKFEDESFHVPHNKANLLCMANSGRPNSNGSQFFITTVKTSWLDKKNVVFGMVLDGADVVTMIEKQGSWNGLPKSRIVITDSGEIDLEEENNNNSNSEEDEEEENKKMHRKNKHKKRQTTS